MKDVRPLAKSFLVTLQFELVVMMECFVLVAVSAGRTRSEASADFGPVAVPRIVSRSRVDVTGCPQSSNRCVRAPGRWSTSLWMKMVSTASSPHSSQTVSALYLPLVGSASLGLFLTHLLQFEMNVNEIFSKLLRSRPNVIL